MTGDRGWDPDRLGNLTLAQFHCLLSRDPPGADRPCASPSEFRARLAEIEAADREWYAQ